MKGTKGPTSEALDGFLRLPENGEDAMLRSSLPTDISPDIELALAPGYGGAAAALTSVAAEPRTR